MVDVNQPPPLKMPQAFFTDAEVRAYMQQIGQILWQLWRRTGGSTDAVSSTQNRDLYDSTGYIAALADTEKRITGVSLETMADARAFHEYRAVSKSSAYTACEYDFVSATSNITVTLPASPCTNCTVIVRNGDGSIITVDGNGRNINGTATIRSGVKNTSMVFHYFIDSDEWFIR